MNQVSFLASIALIWINSTQAQPNSNIRDHYQDPPYSNAELLSFEHGILCQTEYYKIGSLNDRINFTVVRIIDHTRNTQHFGVRATYATYLKEPTVKASIIDSDELVDLLNSSTIIRDLSKGSSPTYSEFHFISRGGFELSGGYTGISGFTDIAVETTDSLSGFPMVGSDIDELIELLRTCLAKIEELKND